PCLRFGPRRSNAVPLATRLLLRWLWIRLVHSRLGPPPRASTASACTTDCEVTEREFLRAQIGWAGALARQPSRIAGQAGAGSLRQCRAIAIFRLLIRVRCSV